MNTASIFSTVSYVTAKTWKYCSLFSPGNMFSGYSSRLLVAGCVVPVLSSRVTWCWGGATSCFWLVSCPCLDPYNWGCILPRAEVVLFTPPPGFQPCHVVFADLWHYPPTLGLPAAPALSTVSCCCWQFSRVLCTHLWQHWPRHFRILCSYVTWFVLLSFYYNFTSKLREE